MQGNLNFAAIDFETATNLPRSACSVGVVVVDNGIITNSKSWLIQPPNNRYLQQNINVHGMTASDTAKASPFNKVWPSVNSFISGRPLVAHNAKFDGGVMKHSAEFYNYPLKNYSILCSKEVGGVAFPECSGNSLSVLSNYLGMQLNHHEALSDANASAQIMISAANKAEANNLQAVSSTYGVPIKKVNDSPYHEFTILNADNMHAEEGFCGYLVHSGRCGEPVENPDDDGRCPTHR